MCRTSGTDRRRHIREIVEGVTVTSFCYIDSTITYDSNWFTEVTRRIVIATPQQNLVSVERESTQQLTKFRSKSVVTHAIIRMWDMVFYVTRMVKTCIIPHALRTTHSGHRMVGICMQHAWNIWPICRYDVVTPTPPTETIQWPYFQTVFLPKLLSAFNIREGITLDPDCRRPQGRTPITWRHHLISGI